MALIESLGFDIFSTDRASGNIRKVGKSAAQAAADIEAANIRVEKATRALAAAQAKHGASSLQARDASNKLAKAQLALDASMKTADASTGKASRNMDRFKAAGAVAGVALFEMGRQSIRTASDISESQSKVSVVFGSSAKSVLAFSDTTASSMGISKAAALAAAGTFGNLLVSLKLPQAEAANMSTKMVTLAADMASFNNASPEEALEAIRSGLVGETEPLRRFGVNMNDATLRTQAMSMGLISNTKEALTPAVKAQAAYGLMLAQTGTAQGDFARTSEGMANQQRILKARFSDLQGELGQKLLPAVNKTLGAIVSLADFMERNGKVIGPLVVGVGALAGAVWTVNTASKAAAATQLAWTRVTGAATTATTAETASVVSLRTALLGVAGPLAAIGGAVGAVWGAEKIGQWRAGSESVRSLTKAMQANAGQASLSRAQINQFETGGLFGFRKQTLNSSEALERFGNAAHIALDQGWNARLGRWQNLGAKQAEFRKQTQQLDGAFAAMVANGNIDEAQAQMRLYERAAEKAGVPLASLRKMFPQYTAAMRDAERPIGAVTTALDRQETALRGNTSALRGNRTTLLGLRGAENEYEASLDDARKALKDNGATLDKHSEKGRANRAALDRIVSSTVAMRDASKENGGSIARQTQIMEAGRQKLIAMGIRFGLTRKQARDYADQVLNIPKRHDTQINAHTAAAERAIRDFKNRTNAQLNAINDERVYIALRPPPGISIRQLMGDGIGVDATAKVFGRLPPKSGPPKGDGFGVDVNATAQTASRGEMSAAMRPILSRYDELAGELGAKISAALQKKMMGNLGSGNASGGWRRQWAIVHGHFPGAVLTSAYRPGARTVSGNQSYHALGRAIDVTPSMAIFNWIRANYGARTKELIFSPAGHRQLKNGANHYYTGAVRSMHFNHVHWAYGGGGVASRPQMIGVSESGPERVLSPVQTRSFDRLVQVLDRRGVASAVGSQPIVIQLVADGSAASNAVVALLRQSIRAKGGNVQAVLGKTG